MLEWIDGRWHLDGRGIHAGRALYAHFEYHGRELAPRVDPEAFEPLPLRWSKR